MLEPYVCVEVLVWRPLFLVPEKQFPRNLNETRFAFIHGEEDRIEGIGTSGLDLEAVLLM